MPTVASILHSAFLILIILAIFNLTIFVHELGHFLAAKWRGLKVERFQIWFGKPIWKKTINGVQYGLGCIPAGGFVALPQMAPMEAIEGQNDAPREALPPISPLDKIIVAVAGPLFSILLGLTAAFVVYKVGKPADLVPTTTIGEVVPDSPGAKAGLRAGDRILAINGKPVQGFTGNLDCIKESIMLSRGQEIHFTIERAGEAKPLELTSTFVIAPTAWWQRRAPRSVGLLPEDAEVVVMGTVPNSPAAKAGLKPEDIIVSVNGEAITNQRQFIERTKAAGANEITLVYKRSTKQDGQVKEQEATIKLTPVMPKTAPEMRPQLGLSVVGIPFVDTRKTNPTPWEQVSGSTRMMWETFSSLASRSSSVGIDQLSGPVGIARVKYQILESEYPFQRIVWFIMLFNVNLAIFNMLPFPILDGGHVTLAVLEWFARRPVRARFLEVIQTSCFFLILAVFFYVTSKDVGDFFGGGKKKQAAPAAVTVEFAP